MARLIVDSADYKGYFILAFLTMGLGILSQINLSYLRAEKRSLTVVLVSTGQMVLNLSLNIFFIVQLNMGVGGIFWGNFLAVSATILVVTPLVLGKVGVRMSWPVMVDLIKFGLPLIPSNIANYIVVASDRYFVKEYVSVAETGIYSLGYKFGSLINNFVTSPFNQIYGPRRLEVFRQDESHHLFARVFTYFVVAIVFVGLGISVLSHNVILMLNHRYWQAYQVVPLVTLAHIFLSFYYHFNIGIVISKKTRFFAYVNITTGLLNLALNFLLIPTYGMWGAATSTCICFAVRASLGFYFSRKFVPVTMEWRRVGTVMAVGLVYYFAITPIDIGGNITSFIVKGLMCCTFPVMLYIARFFNPDEKKLMREYLKKGIAKLRR